MANLQDSEAVIQNSFGVSDVVGNGQLQAAQVCLHKQASLRMWIIREALLDGPHHLITTQ